MADDVASNRTQSERSEKSAKNKKDARGKQSNGENLVRKKTSKDQAKPRKKASRASNEASRYGGAPDAGMASAWQPVKGGAVRNKPTKAVTKSVPMKKGGGVSMMAGPSVMGKVQGGVSVMKPPVRKGATKNVKMEAKVAPPSDTKKEDDQKRMKDLVFNYGPLRYDNSKIDQEFQAIMEENVKTTLLSVSVHIVRFVVVDGNRCCFHVVLQNKTDQHVVFSVVRPPHSRLSVSPKVGFLAPAGHTQIFLMFSCRGQRLPDDLAFVYSIFQRAVEKEDVPLLENDKKRFSTRNTRQILKKKPSTNVWHIGVAFGEKPNKGVSTNCEVKLHHLGRAPKLDKEGLIDKEAPYDPNEQDDKDENLPSAEE